MDLPYAEKVRRRDAHLLRHSPTVFSDSSGIVVRAKPAIEAIVKAAGHAAVAGKEGVAQARNGRQQRRSDHHAGSAFSSGLSSAKPASELRLGSETASTLNIDPMPPRPPPTSRLSAPEMSSETSWLAFAIRVTARVSMPSRFKKSPCGTGPCTRAPRLSAARASAWK